ncbi:hypothetical protein GPJ56_005240 [Histomonas meleagridis]|uniref:uncharacterized protein n=1 Tax=Histomonas meleagridis TaxID=135588 RepID=UPI003559F2BD|nr:hypothetical protein GPJ56_005240 [Histomonas meleagridis]KAH0802090.1 hypothetical protein GO595_005171 [Histomonas meleagridis]
MSEKQRLITKYVTKLSQPVATSFYLHFLLNESDSSARHMLISNLNQISEETGNPNINKCAEAAGSGKEILDYGIYHKKDKEKKSDKDDIKDDVCITQANALFHKLYLMDAIMVFKRVNPQTIDYNSQRVLAESYLVLRHYDKSFRIAKKFKFKDILFASAISLCQFDFAYSMLKEMLYDLRNIQQRNTVVSFYDLIHLAMIICFATSTTRETSIISQRLFAASEFETTVLNDLVTDFINRDFTKFIGELEIIRSILSYSIYTCYNADKIIQMIRANVVVNYVRPFSTVPFKIIENDLSLTETEIIAVLREKIRTNKLNAKIDLVDNCYCGGSGNTTFLDKQEIYVRAISTHEKFLLKEWKKEYR